MALLAGDGERVRIKADGNVGIGTTSPSELLHICGSGDVKIKLEADSDNSGEGDNPEILFSQDGGLVTGMIGFTSDNDFKISNEYNADEGDIFFKTKDTERVRIIGNGNVGIGTAVPTTKLQVAGDISSSGYLSTESHITASGNISSSGTITANSFVGNLSSISNLIANDGANRVLTSDNDGTLSGESAITIDGAAISVAGAITANSNDDDIAFQIKGSSDANLFQANPQSDDKIGIGTDTPPEKLTVQGNISASGGFLGGATQNTGSYDFPGAIMGYTNIGSNTGHASYTITTSYAVPDSEMNVVFVVPKSGKIEIMVQVQVVDLSFSANTINCALSDAASYNTVGAQHEVGAFNQDETGTDIKTIRWCISGLVAGATLQYWFAIKANVGSSAQTLQWGGSGTGRFPDFVMKVTALPSNSVFL